MHNPYPAHLPSFDFCMVYVPTPTQSLVRSLTTASVTAGSSSYLARRTGPSTIPLFVSSQRSETIPSIQRSSPRCQKSLYIEENSSLKPYRSHTRIKSSCVGDRFHRAITLADPSSSLLNRVPPKFSRGRVITRGFVFSCFFLVPLPREKRGGDRCETTLPDCVFLYQVRRPRRVSALPRPAGWGPNSGFPFSGWELQPKQDPERQRRERQRHRANGGRHQGKRQRQSGNRVFFS